MPVELEKELKARVAKKKMSKERKDAYVYGTLRKTGWKPAREKEKELSALLDGLIEFKQADLLGIPGISYSSRRDPEERLRDRLAIGASVAKAAAFTGVAAASGVGAYQIHKHGKGLLRDMKKSFRGMAMTGPALKTLEKRTRKVEGAASRTEELAKKWLASPETGAKVEKFTGLVSAAEKHPRITNMIARMFGRKKKLSNPGKPIEFGAEILGPWSGPTGHTSKIDQYDFPAGLSPAAALALPFPQLMAFLQQRNLLQQVFSSKDGVTRLSSILDDVIQFGPGIMGGEAIRNVFGKLGTWSKKVEQGAAGAAGAGTEKAVASGGRDLTKGLYVPKAAAGAESVPSSAGVTAPQTQAGAAQQAANAAAAKTAVAPASNGSRNPAIAPPSDSAKASAAPQQPTKTVDKKKKQPWSTRTSLLVGAGLGIGAGVGGSYALSPSQQSLSAWLDDIITFADPRPRNTLGEFAGQEGGPDANAMATTYKMGQPPGSGYGPALATGAAGGIAATGSSVAFNRLYQKIKKAKLAKK